MKKRVIIIDDSKTVQRMVAAFVAAAGGEVVGYANDGVEGLKLFKEQAPDLVFLDITMPNMDGKECLKEILGINPMAKIVMLSALNTPDVVKDCLSIGAKAFIDKTSSASKGILKAEVAKHIGDIQAAA